MKKTFAQYCALLVMLLLVGVGCSSKKDVRISQLLFNETLTNAYLDGNAYTGKAWSDDGRTISIECDEGKIVQVDVYHSNGNVAMRNTTLVGAGECFDMDGAPITIEEFAERYPVIISHIQVMIENMLCTPDLN